MSRIYVERYSQWIERLLRRFEHQLHPNTGRLPILDYSELDDDTTLEGLTRGFFQFHRGTFGCNVAPHAKVWRTALKLKPLYILHERTDNQSVLFKRKPDEAVGCFYCEAIFKASRVKEFVGRKETGLCPECGIDSLLPESRIPYLNKVVLRQMNDYWFGPY